VLQPMQDSDVALSITVFSSYDRLFAEFNQDP